MKNAKKFSEYYKDTLRKGAFGKDVVVFKIGNEEDTYQWLQIWRPKDFLNDLSTMKNLALEEPELLDQIVSAVTSVIFKEKLDPQIQKQFGLLAQSSIKFITPLSFSNLTH